MPGGPSQGRFRMNFRRNALLRMSAAAVILLRVAAYEARGGPAEAPYPAPADAPHGSDLTQYSPPTVLDPNVRPIDLNSALKLAGVQNPQLMIARQRVVEAAALRQLAAVQFLPSLNFGTNYDNHN